MLWKKTDINLCSSFSSASKKDDARLPELIREEIKARTWFVLCDSDHARASPWVQEEMAFVTSNKPKDTIVTIDLATDLDVKLDGDVPPFVRKLRPLLKRATVFLSYVGSDRQIGVPNLRGALGAGLSSIFGSEAIETRYRLGGLAYDGGKLEEALEHGFVLLLLSYDYLTNIWCKKERELAFKILASRPSNIVPVIVRDADYVKRQLPMHLPPNLPHGLVMIDITEADIPSLLHLLKTRPMT